MKRRRFSEEQSIGILKEHEGGMPAQDVIRKHGIANGTFYRWKSKFGGMEIEEVAERSGASVGACKMRLKRALGKGDADQVARATAEVKRLFFSEHKGMYTIQDFSGLRSLSDFNDALADRESTFGK